MKGFSVVLVRVLGAWALFTGVQNLLLLPAVNMSDYTDLQVFLTVGSHAIYILIGIVLWMKALKCVEYCLTGVADQQDASAITQTEIVEAGSFLIGLYWIAKQLPAVINSFLVSSQYEHKGYSYLLQELGVLIITLFLMLGNKLIGKFFIKLRSS